MTVAEADWQRAVELLSAATTVALACHVDPDGDAIGSMLALQRVLRTRGVETVAGWGYARDTDPQGLSIPPIYTFLPDIETLVGPEEFPTEPEVMVAFDTGAAARLGSLRSAAEHAGTLVLIDHHAIGDPFGDVRLVDGDAAATAVLVDELITRLGADLDVDVATLLYTALVTDTGRFSYASTTPSVLRLAARLMDRGIDHETITRHVYETASFGYVKVLGAALGRAEIVPEAGLVWMPVLRADLERHGISWQDTEGFIDVLRRVEAASATMVAKEQADGRWKVSMRSRGAVDVGLVARALGGGGHRLASAFVDEGPLRALVDRVVAALARAEAHEARAARNARDERKAPVASSAERRTTTGSGAPA